MNCKINLKNFVRGIDGMSLIAWNWLESGGPKKLFGGVLCRASQLVRCSRDSRWENFTTFDHPSVRFISVCAVKFTSINVALIRSTSSKAGEDEMTENWSIKFFIFSGSRKIGSRFERRVIKMQFSINKSILNLMVFEVLRDSDIKFELTDGLMWRGDSSSYFVAFYCILIFFFRVSMVRWLVLNV